MRLIICVDPERIWIILKEKGVPTHIMVVYYGENANQKVAVKTDFEATAGKFNIVKGVRQDCILSHLYSTSTQRK